MPPKVKQGGKKSLEEEEKARLEEEERLRPIREAEEKRIKAEQRKEQLLELLKSFDETRYLEQNEVISQFNESIQNELDEKELRKKQESWDQWMNQEGKPDCNSAPSISSFISQCLVNEINQEEVFKERHLVNRLIKEIKHLSLDYPEKRELYYDAIIKLSEMQEERLGQLSLEYLLNPKDLDPETEDLIHDSEDPESGLIYLLWGNFGKNPRRREVDWESRKIKVELKKKQAIENVALRVMWTAEDKLSAQLPIITEVTPFESATEDIVVEETEVIDIEDEAKSISQSEKKEPSATASVHSRKLSQEPEAKVQSNLTNLNTENDAPEEDVESQGSVERVDLEGQEGVGGVWHIDYLSLPPPEKINDKWKITRYYGETLQNAEPIPEPFNIQLPLLEYPLETNLTVGRWNGEKWTKDGIDISEEKDGSMMFSTEELGSFRFFLDRHSSNGPLVDNWMIQPNNEIIEFLIVLQNVQVQFDVLPSGRVNLIEKSEKTFFPPGCDRIDVDLDTLIAQMEENGLFVFTTDSSKEYLEILPKSGDVLSRAYSNIASVSHLNRIQSSSYNPSLEENQVTFMVGSNTLICTDDQFFVIEDNYIPPEPPIPPPETEDEVDEAKEQYEIDLEKYNEKIADEKEKFEPDFGMPREGCNISASLKAVLECDSRISQQNLTVYKLLKKSMILEL